MLPLVFLSRPLRQAQAFAERLKATAAPHETLISPLSVIEPVAFEASAFEDAGMLVLTSVNAIPSLHGVSALKGLTAWCVGPATALAAKQAGFVPIEGGGDAATMVPQMLKALQNARPSGPILHAHGSVLARDIAADLRAAGYDATGVEVYRARLLDWPADTRTALAQTGRAIIAPLFSPRAATAFAQQLGDAPSAHILPVAISRACADALPPALRAQTTIAQRPDADAMLDKLVEVLSHHSPCGLSPAEAKDK